ncbi:MAG: hypothetical protein IPK80_16435 [Nannocystis sp.]|nr:hypothetical protein [Nannocystis sp.]
MNTRLDLNYFTHPDFLSLDGRRGVLRSRGGTRMLAISDDFLRGFVAACEHEAGSAAPFILRRCGRFFGERLSRRFESELNTFAGCALRDRTMIEFDALLRDLWRGCGYGALDVDWARGERGFLPVRLEESPMQDIGPSGHVGDDMFCGILEGFFATFCDGEMRCVQTGDRRLGDRDGTTFILAPFEAAKKIEAMVADKLPHRRIVEELAA